MALSTISSSSSSSVTSPWLYDVFLSFKGEDTRDTFTAHLYRALTQKGIRTFIDKDELRRGDEISPALLRAIEGSRISIIVLSKNYASSSWCLDELLKILDQCKESMQQRVLPVFYHVDPSDVRHQRKSFGEALAKHAERLNGDRVKLQMWKAALREVANLSGDHLIINGRINESEFIEEIVQDVSRMTNDHLYLHVADHPVGLKPHVDDVNLILSVGTKDIRMIGIFGVGGIGKTTLAKAIYNSTAFRFEASCFLPIDSDTENQVNRLVQLQETLLFKILGDCRSLKVDNIDRGINMIKHRLQSKRVLLILDSVDHLDQLKTLAGARDWFGEGSRIIITTRDQHLLTTHGVDSTYEMTKLNHDDAVELFCWHAFKREKPIDGFGEFVEQIVNYVQRLPLALKVLGSDLYGRSESEWESAMDEYKQIPHKEIQKILQTSYDRLRENEKKVFLDIAFFFNGQWIVDDYIKILDSCGFYPNFSIPRLKEKCLISESDIGILQMHDLLRDMGREVVRQESPNNPGARSRLFVHKDVREVLEEDTGTDRVEVIAADFPNGADTIHLSSKAFKKMKRLRLFRCRNAQFSGELNSLPDGIRVLDWPNCHLQSMPSKFLGDKLFILSLPGSRIQEIHLEFKNLTFMNFCGCKFITKFPDISRSPNLKKIYLNFCKNLDEVHEPVGFLDKLDELLLYECDKLKSIPSLQLRSLRVLDLGGCSSLQNFPEIGCEMKHLSNVELRYAIKENVISFFGLFHLFPNLDYLDLSGSDIVSIPSSIKTSVGLWQLILNDCKQLQEIKEFPPNLKAVTASGCISLESLPEISKEFNFPRLQWIDLARCYKVNMGNWMSNPPWNQAQMIFPGKKIPDWFSHCKEITSNSHRCEFDIKVAPPYNLDDIIGIAFCAIIEPVATIQLDIYITNTKASRYRGTRAVFDEIDSDHVWLRYLTTKDIMRTTEDITHLRAVSVDQADDLGIIFESTPNLVDNLRIIFENKDPNSMIFKRCGVHLLYKQHEQNAKDHAGVPHHENVDVHLNAPIEHIGNLANPMGGSQLSKRRRVDYDDYEDDHNIESNLYAQQRKPASTLEIKLCLHER